VAGKRKQATCQPHLTNKRNTKRERTRGHDKVERRARGEGRRSEAGGTDLRDRSSERSSFQWRGALSAVAQRPRSAVTALCRSLHCRCNLTTSSSCATLAPALLDLSAAHTAPVQIPTQRWAPIVDGPSFFMAWLFLSYNSVPKELD
jgi:hypothetical protein